MVKLSLERLSKHPRRRIPLKELSWNILSEEEVEVVDDEFEFPNFEFVIYSKKPSKGRRKRTPGRSYQKNF